MIPGPSVAQEVQMDDGSPTASRKIGAALSSVSRATAIPESEIKRWRRTFDANAKEIGGGK